MDLRVLVSICGQLCDDTMNVKLRTIKLYYSLYHEHTMVLCDELVFLSNCVCIHVMSTDQIQELLEILDDQSLA